MLVPTDKTLISRSRTSYPEYGIRIMRRDDDPSTGVNGAFVAGGIIGIAALAAVCIWFILQSRKRNLAKGFSKRGYQLPAEQEEATRRPRTGVVSARGASQAAPANFDAAVAEANRNNPMAGDGNENGNGNAVGRNESIRSVMTLPVYQRQAGDHEKVLGVAGERDGIDVVVELPTAEDEEALREDEMEALYQVRLARRRQNEEREERRRLRRDARGRGDLVAMAELSAQARTASSSSIIPELRSEHERLKLQRQRAASSVSYADLGVARNDGTRLRAGSMESERTGLLSDAASIALSGHSRNRAQSSGSLASLNVPVDLPSSAHLRSPSGASTPQRIVSHSTLGMSDDADLGGVGMPLSEIPLHDSDPPGYEDVNLDDRSATSTPTPGFGEMPPVYSTSSAESNYGSGSAANGRSTSNPRPDMQSAKRPPLRDSQSSSHNVRPQVHVPQIAIEPPSAYPRDDP